MNFPPSYSASGDVYAEELASEHFRAGQAWYARNRFAEALREFQTAQRLSGRPDLHYNIALCRQRLGHLDQAVGSLERYLTESPENGRPSAEGWLRALKAQRAMVVRWIKRPVHRRALFWSVAGGMAAVTAASVAIAALLGERREDDTKSLTKSLTKSRSKSPPKSLTM